MVNYEADTAALWQAIFHHAESLSSLTIHTPPQQKLDTWTPTVIEKVNNGLKKLKILELDISLDEAEYWLSRGAALPHPSVVDELVKMSQLEVVRININLEDSASTFAGQHIFTVMGCISFPSPNKEPCERLARLIFDKFQSVTPLCSLKHLEVRFPRRCWDDRCQFWTAAYSVHVKKNNDHVDVTTAGEWGDYLPPWPAYGRGVLGELINQAYAEQREGRL